MEWNRRYKNSHDFVHSQLFFDKLTKTFPWGKEVFSTDVPAQVHNYVNKHFTKEDTQIANTWKICSIICHQGIASRSIMRYFFRPTGIATIKKTDKAPACLQGWGAAGLRHCRRSCKTGWPLWKQLLRKWNKSKPWPINSTSKHFPKRHEK